jgi:hypothetical protein
MSSFGIHRAALQPDFGDSLVGSAQVWVTAQSGTASNRVSVVSLKMEKFSPAMKSLMALPFCETERFPQSDSSKSTTRRAERPLSFGGGNLPPQDGDQFRTEGSMILSPNKADGRHNQMTHR